MSVLNNIDGTLINTDVTLIKEKIFKKILDNIVKRDKDNNYLSHRLFDYRMNALLRYLREEIYALKCCTVKNLCEVFDLNADEIRLLCSISDVVSDVDNEIYYYWSEEDYGSCSSNIGCGRICKTPDCGNISFNINLETAIALLTNQEINVNWFGKQINLNDLKDSVFKTFIKSTINHQTHVTFNNMFYDELKEYCIKHC